MLLGHLQAERQPAQSLEVGIANGQRSIVVLLIPSAGVASHGYLEALVAVLLNHRGLGAVPEAAVGAGLLVFTVPQHHLCVGDSRGHQHCCE